MSKEDETIGEVTAAEAYEVLRDNSGARLVDVRSRAEWTFVGVPVVGGGRGATVLLEWQSYPNMEIDPNFATALAEACPDKTTPLYFICRSGARSHSAAELAARAGYEHCFNVVDGFEGPPDDRGHRGTLAGWKAAGLPWRQT